jgi:thiamine biosynthesis lipoprotein ApbE
MHGGAANAGARVAVAALVVVAFACGGCTPQPNAATQAPYEYQRIIMGAPCRLVIHAADESTADDAAQAVFARMGEIEEALSDWMPESEVRRLPAAAASFPTHHRIWPCSDPQRLRSPFHLR